MTSDAFLKAKEFDKFFTRPEVAAQCFDFISQTVDARAIDLWVEPSAGAGAFLNLLPENRIGLDIDPPAGTEGIMERADFLGWRGPAGGNVVTIGNPPFGKNSALAVRFFNHAATFSSMIAFIVPRTFQKGSVQNRLHANFHLLRELEIAPFSFTFVEEAYDVPCVFQIWQKRAVHRPLVERKTLSNDFQFVCKDEAHFAFQRVGARAGAVYASREDFSWRSPSSHYFIKDCTPEKRVREILEDIHWDSIKSRTAGNPSIAKSELIREYEAVAA